MKDRVRQSLLCLVPILVLSLLILLHDPNYYYNNDSETQYVPAHHEIVRQLNQGQFPFLSGNSWYGGNLVGAGEYGLFSPVMLLITELVVGVHLPEALEAALFAIIHQAILGLGVYWLAASFGLTRQYRFFA